MTDRGHRAYPLSCGGQACPDVATRGPPWPGGAGVGAIGRSSGGQKQARTKVTAGTLNVAGRADRPRPGLGHCPGLSRARALPSLSLSLRHNAREGTHARIHSVLDQWAENLRRPSPSR